MTLYAYDAAYPPDPAVYKANGGVAANVYVSGIYAQDRAHVAALRADGIAPWPNYEVGLWELVQDSDDYAAGRRAALRGIPDAIGCGFPADGTIWFPFSIDVNLDPTRYNEAANAFRGIQDVNGGQYRISCYGQGGLIAYLRAKGVIREKGWLSASSSFPGYDRKSEDICLWQEFGDFIPGHSTDRNVITDVGALHAWWPPGSPYATNRWEPFMALTDAQQSDLYNWVRQIQFGLVNEGQLPFAQRGEITDRIRSLATTTTAISTKVNALPTTGAGTVDTAQLAQELASLLGHEVAAQVASDLSVILTKGAQA